MLKATFTELRQHAKAYFDMVEKGERIRIIRHGKVIAEICPANDEEELPSWKQPGIKLVVKGASITKAILADREDDK